MLQVTQSEDRKKYMGLFLILFLLLQCCITEANKAIILVVFYQIEEFSKHTTDVASHHTILIFTSCCNSKLGQHILLLSYCQLRRQSQQLLQVYRIRNTTCAVLNVYAHNLTQNQKVRTRYPMCIISQKRVGKTHNLSYVSSMNKKYLAQQKPYKSILQIRVFL